MDFFIQDWNPLEYTILVIFVQNEGLQSQS